MSKGILLFLKTGDVMKVYTKQGDGGMTSLLSGEKVAKYDKRIEAVGTVDELTSHLGKIKLFIKDTQAKKDIEEIQKNLIRLMAEIVDEKRRNTFFNKENVKKLEEKIDEYQNLIPPIKEFVLPGDNETSVEIDIARTIARRAERRIAEVLDKDVIIKQYMNRLSDYLYILARYMDFYEKIYHQIHKNAYRKSQNTSTAITLDVAKEIALHVEEKAKEMGLAVVIALVNPEGNPICIHILDGAFLISYELAVKKAYTSVALKTTTESLKEITQPGNELGGLEEALENKITTIGGGAPVIIDKKVFGGIGVSGGSAEEDIYLAQYGVKIAREVLNKWQQKH